MKNIDDITLDIKDLMLNKAVGMLSEPTDDDIGELLYIIASEMIGFMLEKEEKRRRKLKESKNEEIVVDEFIDIDPTTLATALAVTKERKKDKEWNKSYPAPDIVRQEFRSKQTPLLIIYPLNPKCSNVLDKVGNVIEGTVQYNASDEPFIGLAISFPSSETNHAISYVVNQVGDFVETEDMFDDLSSHSDEEDSDEEISEEDDEEEQDEETPVYSKGKNALICYAEAGNENQTVPLEITYLGSNFIGTLNNAKINITQIPVR